MDIMNQPIRKKRLLQNEPMVQDATAVFISVIKKGSELLREKPFIKLANRVITILIANPEHDGDFGSTLINDL